MLMNISLHFVNDFLSLLRPPILCLIYYVCTEMHEIDRIFFRKLSSSTRTFKRDFYHIYHSWMIADRHSIEALIIICPEQRIAVWRAPTSNN